MLETDRGFSPSMLNTPKWSSGSPFGLGSGSVEEGFGFAYFADVLGDWG